jgi:alkanesulfonate monooxygenase SsuD/methylene tetrahydromethanopterin reductase-like flavin-dependent oxidoreductase (luciferase family)
MVAIQLTADAGSPFDLPGVARDVEALGYEARWIGEINLVDAVVPASVAAVNTSSIVIGSLFNVFTRAPTNVALAAAGLGHLAPGRMALVPVDGRAPAEEVPDCERHLHGRLPLRRGRP